MTPKKIFRIFRFLLLETNLFQIFRFILLETIQNNVILIWEKWDSNLFSQTYILWTFILSTLFLSTFILSTLYFVKFYFVNSVFCQLCFCQLLFCQLLFCQLCFVNSVLSTLILSNHDDRYYWSKTLPRLPFSHLCPSFPSLTSRVKLRILWPGGIWTFS